MKKEEIFGFFLLTGLICGCQEQGLEQSYNALEEGKACVEVVPFELVTSARNSSSRTDIVVDPVHGVQFNWNATDSLGVFPLSGYQAAFSLNGQIEQNKAIFDGGTWLLRNNATYAAYYPFSERAYDLTCNLLEADYRTLKQTGNNRTTHLPVHDYLATSFSQVTASQDVNFSLDHLGSLMRFVITAPASDTWNYLCLKGVANEFVVDATYNLYETHPTLHPVTMADSIRINMEGISTTDEERQIVLYTMAASNQNASPDEWCITMCGTTGIYRDTLRDYTDADGNFHDIARIMAPGSAYSRTITFDGANSVDDWSIPINIDGESYDPNVPILSPGYIGILATTYEYDAWTSSRMDVEEVDNSLTFVWAQDDVLGIFPDQGNQTAFPLSSQAGESLALFDGNDWALRDGWTYAAYFPFSQENFHISPNQLPVSFDGQILNGNVPLANPGNYNYCYAPLTKVDSDQPIKFEMKGLASIVKLTFASPVDDNFYQMTMDCGNRGFAHSATYDLMSQQPCLVENSYQSSPLSFDMVNYRMAIGETREAYLMLMPGDYTNEEIVFTFLGASGQICSATYTPLRSFISGKGYHISLELEVNEEINNMQ